MNIAQEIGDRTTSSGSMMHHDRENARWQKISPANWRR
jgi:hypothetical protein